jgi:pimeloyl-ACP methyl ester carboxylesterase
LIIFLETIQQREGLKGIASFRYDKRGVGQSEGSFLSAGFKDNLADSVAAFGLVSRRPEKNLPVFVIGHSEGAYHAAALAAVEGAAVDGVALLSPSAQTGLATSQWQTAQIAESLPAFPRTILKLLRVDLREQQRKSVKKILATTQDVVRMQGKRVNARWMREFLTFDPLPFLASLKMPVLAVTGEKDIQVDPADLNTIARTAPGPVTIHRVPDMSHLLRRDPKSASLTDYKRQVRLPTDPEVLALIVNWVEEISRIEKAGDRHSGVEAQAPRHP